MRSNCRSGRVIRHPEICAGCGAALVLADGGRVRTGYLMIDLMISASEQAGLEVIQSDRLYYEHESHCGHRTCAEIGRCAGDSAWTVALSERYLAGPMLVALV